MFTGIIEELGRVVRIIRRGKTVRFIIEASAVIEGVRIGDSIAVNGVCFTVTERGNNHFGFEAMPETLKKTTMGMVKLNEKVNLERSLEAGGRLSGHFVYGHVDCIGLIRKKIIREGNLCFEIAIPPEFMKYVLPKGSIAVDGISLTVADKKGGVFSVYIIPHTFAHTTLNFKGPSGRVNVEFDILVKKYALSG